MATHSSSSEGWELSDPDFEKISRLVYDQCGIHLHEGKKELVKARLGKRMRSGSFTSFRDYLQYVVKDPTGQELVHLLDSISTNFTHFFREQKHFDYLRTEFLPELMARKRGRSNKIRFWSAGCSSGEEPYSLAITLLESVDSLSLWEVEILATDISTKVLQTATSGAYATDRVRSIPAEIVRKYFLKGQNSWRGYVKVKDQVRRLVRFQRLNFMETFPFREAFDGIFCRNVMIYFDKKTQGALVNRFHGCLEKGGVFFIGHSESLTGIEHPFQYIRPAIYKKA
jgi:chemotaxis protein methyltransferase CheR